jgi:hypothetical protein
VGAITAIISGILPFKIERLFKPLSYWALTPGIHLVLRHKGRYVGFIVTV